MHLALLKLTHFKNYEFQELKFCPRLNLIAGLNGMGKTNLLDAIYYLCMGKSHFTNTDRNVVQHGRDFFRLEGLFFLKEKKEKVVARVQPGKLKVFEKNDSPYLRLSDHVGLFPIVFKAPDDIALALEGSEQRRRFLDNTLCQIDNQYLQHLLTYNKVLQKRNALLKQAAGHLPPDPALLEVYDAQLLQPAVYIFEKRKDMVEKLTPVFNHYYRSISYEQEEAVFTYRSQLKDNSLARLLIENREKDRLLQRTTAGIHKDDLHFRMNERPLKTFASQGQLKSFVLALKLAQYDLLNEEKGLSPILLLDDLFDKLDEKRIKHLLELLVKEKFGQVFITDTHPERGEDLARHFGSEYQKFIIANGSATEP